MHVRGAVACDFWAILVLDVQLKYTTEFSTCMIIRNHESISQPRSVPTIPIP